MLTDITPIYSQTAFRSIRFGNIFATRLHNIEKEYMAFVLDFDIQNLTNMPSVQDIVRVYDTIQFRKKWKC